MRKSVFLFVLPAAMSLALYSIAWAQQATTPSRSGSAVYAADCAGCHSGGFIGFFNGAPEVGDGDDWVALTPKGVEGLTAATIGGIGKMAARGACSACSDAEIRAAVEFMLEQSQ